MNTNPPKTPTPQIKCPVSILKFRAQVAKGLVAKTIRKIPSKASRDLSVTCVSYGLSSATKQIRHKRHTHSVLGHFPKHNLCNWWVIAT